MKPTYNMKYLLNYTELLRRNKLDSTYSLVLMLGLSKNLYKALRPGYNYPLPPHCILCLKRGYRWNDNDILELLWWLSPQNTEFPPPITSEGDTNAITPWALLVLQGFYTYASFAQFLGVDKSTLSRWFKKGGGKLYYSQIAKLLGSGWSFNDLYTLLDLIK